MTNKQKRVLMEQSMGNAGPIRTAYDAQYRAGKAKEGEGRAKGGFAVLLLVLLVFGAFYFPSVKSSETWIDYPSESEKVVENANQSVLGTLDQKEIQIISNWARTEFAGRKTLVEVSEMIPYGGKDMQPTFTVPSLKQTVRVTLTGYYSSDVWAVLKPSSQSNQ